MPHNHYRKSLLTATLNATGSAVDVRQAVSLAVDTTWAMVTTVAPLALVTGDSDSNTVTFPATAAATEGDFVKVSDALGGAWIVALDVDGGGIANAGPVFTAVPAANRAVVDISALVGAADVAAACVAAFVLLGAPVTLVDNLDGSVLFTCDDRGLASAPVVLDATEAGAGSITSVGVVAGVNSTIDLTNNAFLLAGHGLLTGQSVKLTIGAGAVPAPLVAGTAYYVIRVDAANFRLATTLANAIAGTAIVLTDQGTAAQTVTVTSQANAGTATLEYTTDAIPGPASVWTVLATVNLVTDTSPVATRIPVNYYGWIRSKLALTSGAVSAFNAVAFGKELN